MRTLILGTVLLGGALATPQSLTVTARLVDKAGIPNHTLQRAQVEAVYLAGTGGITLVWVNSDEPRAFTFVLKNCGCGAGKTTLGRTLLGDDPHTSLYSWIYFDNILSATRRTILSPADLLGAAIAHELGHLLGLPHVREGIMRANWTYQHLALLARRGMRFTQAEALDMQTEIRARRMLQLEDSDLLAVADQKRPVQ